MADARAVTSEGVQKTPKVRLLIDTGLTALLSKTTIIFIIKKNRDKFCDYVQIFKIVECLYIEFLRIA